MMRLDTEKFAYPSAQQRDMILDATAEARGKLTMVRNRLLVATFVEPQMTAGGIIRPAKTLDESRFQGKAGLVLAMGPLAFQFNDPKEFETPVPNIGDWIFYRASDTFECGFAGVLCRTIFDDAVMGIIEDPEIIY